MDYSSYDVVDIYREKDPNTVIKNFELDTSKKLYMMNRYKFDGVKRFFLKIYDIETKTILYKILVKSHDVIG